jgi:hypothetical protein
MTTAFECPNRLLSQNLPNLPRRETAAFHGAVMILLNYTSLRVYFSGAQLPFFDRILVSGSIHYYLENFGAMGQPGKLR